MRSSPDLLTRFLRLILRVFFRSVEVVGAESLPLGRPMVLVANHVNGLVDPVLLLGPLPVRPRLLAKSTLWDNPLVRPFANWAGSIPVYRRQDEVDTAQNEETFIRCHELLSEGGVLALFPEGKSHSEPALQPLKTGLARIVLGAERRFPGLGTRIVPVGLTFDRKETFRSRALVQVGEPIAPEPEEDVRVLTARVSQALEEVTLNYGTWEDARLIARAAEIYGRAGLELPGRRRLAETFPIQRAFIEGYEDLSRRFPERVEAVAEAVRSYDRLLHALHLRDDQVAAAYPVSPVLRFVGRTLLRLLIHLPLAVIGTVLNGLTYKLIGPLVILVARRVPDQIATYKLFGAVLLFPLTWIAEALLAARWLGWWAAPLVLLLAPLAGWAALLFHETHTAFWREAWAYLLLRTRRRVAEQLRACRETLLEEVGKLEELWRGQGERQALAGRTPPQEG
ncbi:MAG TPA: lysophospholipid acyltransferase family protein [Thermoanaerobaculia bacterium]|nr:lysophospholipid acyltransferase family protein [Thermoanaerobaculia bacterium]